MKTQGIDVEFSVIADVVSRKLGELQEGKLYRAAVLGEHLWDVYLNAFPEGTNPVFRERTVHDCSCCRSFIKNIGNVVSIQDGKIVSLWDLAVPYPFDVVFATLAKTVREYRIDKAFYVPQANYGAVVNYETTITGQLTWNHFYCKINSQFVTTDVNGKVAESSAAKHVIERSLKEITTDATDTVIGLIEDSNLYRGQENLDGLRAFRVLQRKYLNIDDSQDQELFVWENHNHRCRTLRNSAIGTLLQDLSEGTDVDTAVRKYEAVVAPQNYKRPKSLITPKMIKDMSAKVTELGYEDSLQRRFATIKDISVNNVLHINNSVRGKTKDGLADLLMPEAGANTFVSKGATEIKVDDFVSDVLPGSTEVVAVVENHMAGNFVSLIAPAVEGSKRLLRWDNDFSWVYQGNVTDAIKERVKRAGGNISAIVRTSLSWFNYDDLDLHMHEPDGTHVYFGNKMGKLDVDMNAGGGHSREPVENIAMNKLKNGSYRFVVRQYSKRESIDVGFVVEFEYAGQVHTFTYDEPLSTGKTVDVFTLRVVNGKVVEVSPSAVVRVGLPAQEIWGIKTGTQVPVDVITTSPNHWDENKDGLKHWFFMLRGCVNPDNARGLYNEFLHPDLYEHRKVFEVLGDKLKCPHSTDQLSGLGFSQGKDSLTVYVTKNKKTRPYKINF